MSASHPVTASGPPQRRKFNKLVANPVFEDYHHSARDVRHDIAFEAAGLDAAALAYAAVRAAGRGAVDRPAFARRLGEFRGLQLSGSNFNPLLFGAAAGIALSLIAQIGEHPLPTAEGRDG